MPSRDLVGLPCITEHPVQLEPAHPLRPIRPRDAFVAGRLLLLLDNGATYGYELRGELDEHSVSIDSAVVYRTLRKLEADGWVTSRWIESGVGPRRRSYTLTAEGRRQLDEIAGAIGAIRDLHDTFLDEHRHATERRRGRSA